MHERINCICSGTCMQMHELIVVQTLRIRFWGISVFPPRQAVEFSRHHQSLFAELCLAMSEKFARRARAAREKEAKNNYFTEIFPIFIRCRSRVRTRRRELMTKIYRFDRCRDKKQKKHEPPPIVVWPRQRKLLSTGDLLPPHSAQYNWVSGNDMEWNFN